MKISIKKMQKSNINLPADGSNVIKCKKLVTRKKTRLKCKEQNAKPSSKTKTKN